MAGSSEFAELRERQRTAVVVNQRAQLDLYGRELARLREQNRTLKREVKTLRREAKATNSKSRKLLRKARRMLNRPGMQNGLPKVLADTTTESATSQSGAPSGRPALGYTVDGLSIRARFDPSYSAQENGLDQASEAWGHYLQNGLSVGAAISASHEAALRAWQQHNSEHLFVMKALKVRNPAAPLLARQTAESLCDELMTTRALIQSSSRNFPNPDSAALLAVLARFVPAVEPGREAEALGRLLVSDGDELSALSRLSSQCPAAVHSGRRWGVIAAAM